MMTVTDYMKSRAGYRLIVGHNEEMTEEDKSILFPYMRRVKTKTFSDEKEFNKIFPK